MKYTLKEDARFVCGITSFGLRAGATVTVRQVDHTWGKVLIDFGDGLVGWFVKSTLDQFAHGVVNN
jgi:hypothetical protein